MSGTVFYGLTAVRVLSAVLVLMSAVTSADNPQAPTEFRITNTVE